MSEERQRSEVASPTGGEVRNIPDCTSCKAVGAGGCFAGAVYALYERSKLPVGNRNRHLLAVIGLGECGGWSYQHQLKGVGGMCMCGCGMWVV